MTQSSHYDRVCKQICSGCQTARSTSRWFTWSLRIPGWYLCSKLRSSCCCCCYCCCRKKLSTNQCPIIPNRPFYALMSAATLAKGVAVDTCRKTKQTAKLLPTKLSRVNTKRSEFFVLPATRQTDRPIATNFPPYFTWLYDSLLLFLLLLLLLLAST